MRVTKLFAGLGLSLLALLSLPSCEDDNNGMDPSLQLYQQYEVIVTSAGKAAYANFRMGSAAGDRVELTDGSWLKINALTTYYQPSVSATDPEFNYVAVLDENHKRAIFTFHRSKETELVNEVSLENLPRIGIPVEARNITNGVPVNFALGDIEPTQADITLRTTSGKSNVYRAQYTPLGFEFRDVPAGTYSLVADYVQVTPTESNDGKAGGTIAVVSRNFLENVKVN